ncbi:hypothetical protein A2T98_20685 [Nodularia spumigena CENA596]|uniref:Uncharacterized protein n=1 Tax=Nodularia spumigena CENA596 TaxID=1819295 RepID=A0A166I665_NODSP|nr:hypothetical protein A2T98_20685 [Nodularia spumigena CENA596]
MNLFHAKAQRRKGTKKNKGNFGISYFDSATPELRITNYKLVFIASLLLHLATFSQGETLRGKRSYAEGFRRLGGMRFAHATRTINSHRIAIAK